MRRWRALRVGASLCAAGTQTAFLVRLQCALFAPRACAAPLTVTLPRQRLRRNLTAAGRLYARAQETMQAALLLLGLLGGASAFLAPATPALGIRTAPAAARLRGGARAPLLGGACSLRQARLAATNRAGVRMKVDLATAKVRRLYVGVRTCGHAGFGCFQAPNCGAPRTRRWTLKG